MFLTDGIINSLSDFLDMNTVDVRISDPNDYENITIKEYPDGRDVVFSCEKPEDVAVAWEQFNMLIDYCAIKMYDIIDYEDTMEEILCKEKTTFRTAVFSMETLTTEGVEWLADILNDSVKNLLICIDGYAVGMLNVSAFFTAADDIISEDRVFMCSYWMRDETIHQVRVSMWFS